MWAQFPSITTALPDSVRNATRLRPSIRLDKGRAARSPLALKRYHEAGYRANASAGGADALLIDDLAGIAILHAFG
jgi:hypothetical protein